VRRMAVLGRSRVERAYVEDWQVGCTTSFLSLLSHRPGIRRTHPIEETHLFQLFFSCPLRWSSSARPPCPKPSTQTTSPRHRETPSERSRIQGLAIRIRKGPYCGHRVLRDYSPCESFAARKSVDSPTLPNFQRSDKNPRSCSASSC